MKYGDTGPANPARMYAVCEMMSAHAIVLVSADYTSKPVEVLSRKTGQPVADFNWQSRESTSMLASTGSGCTCRQCAASTTLEAARQQVTDIRAGGRR